MDFDKYSLILENKFTYRMAKRDFNDLTLLLKLSKKDPSKNFKYTYWMMDQVKNKGAHPLHISDLVLWYNRMYIKINRELRIRDIYETDWNTLDQLFQSGKVVSRSQERLARKDPGNWELFYHDPKTGNKVIKILSQGGAAEWTHKEIDPDTGIELKDCNFCIGARGNDFEYKRYKNSGNRLRHIWFIILPHEKVEQKVVLTPTRGFKRWEWYSFTDTRNETVELEDATEKLIDLASRYKFVKEVEGFDLVQQHTKDKETIEYQIEKSIKGKWNFNKEGLVDVVGNIYIKNKTIFKSISFGKVTGDFYCADIQLTTLEGSPREVGGNFQCDNNELRTLEGSPMEVVGNFQCDNNELITLEGAPRKVGGNFQCDDNELTTLKGSPMEVGGNFQCDNNELITLEGAPRKVGGNFYCDENQLVSLKGAPREVKGGFYCTSNRLTSLEGAPERVEGDFICTDNHLTTLKGSPKVVIGDFTCSGNRLTSLEGAPERVEGDFTCSRNQLITLKGAPKRIEGSFYCTHNKLTTLEGAPEKIEGHFYCDDNRLITIKGVPEEIPGDFNCIRNKLTNTKGWPKVGGISRMDIW
jgi:hypothetical protein